MVTTSQNSVWFQDGTSISFQNYQRTDTWIESATTLILRLLMVEHLNCGTSITRAELSDPDKPLHTLLKFHQEMPIEEAKPELTALIKHGIRSGSTIRVINPYALLPN
jgi:hypothetical protein